MSFWPATLVAWCYPLTGFFIFWQGFPTCASAYWLPWLLSAVQWTVRGNRIAPVGLALATGLALVSGHIDVAALVLLVSGLFALWCLLGGSWTAVFSGSMGKVVLALIAGWGLGFLLAAPNILPVMEYARTGARMVERFTWPAGTPADRPGGFAPGGAPGHVWFNQSRQLPDIPEKRK